MSDTDAERERRIRERAYFLWLEAGCPEGRSVEFWNRAQMLEAAAPPAGNLPSSAITEGTADDVTREGRRADPAAHRASPFRLSSSRVTQASMAPRPLSFLLVIVV